MTSKDSFCTYPKSWEVVKLGLFVESEKGKKPKNQASNYSSSYSLPYIDIQAFEKGVISSYTDGRDCRICHESDFLMVWDGSRSGLVGKGMKGALGSTLVRINFPLMENQYAFYFLQSKYQQINSRAKGSGTPHVDPDLLWNYEFPIPPLNEQRRIVSKIEELFSELDRGVESLEKAGEQLKVYRQAVLKHAFEGKLTTQWREENKDKLETSEQLLARIKLERETLYEQQLNDWEVAVKEWAQNERPGKKPQKPKKLRERNSLSPNELVTLPPLPAGYAYTCLATLGELGRGKSKHRPRNAAELFGGVYPFIQTGEVKAASRIIRQYSQTYNEQGLQQSKLWPEGTLCITIAANIAETAFLGFKSCFPDSIVGFNATKTLVVPEYIELFIKSTRTRIEAYAPATAQKNINLNTLESLVIPLCSIREQKLIVDLLEKSLSVIEKQVAEIESLIYKIKVLRQSILKQAFSGQLIVQDPNDEPASVLLARIRIAKSTEKLRAQA